MTTEYRNEFGDVTRDEALADGWTDEALAVDCREDGADWAPWSYEGEQAVTADRIAHCARVERDLAHPRPDAGSDARIAACHAAAAALTGEDWRRIGDMRHRGSGHEDDPLASTPNGESR